MSHSRVAIPVRCKGNREGQGICNYFICGLIIYKPAACILVYMYIKPRKHIYKWRSVDVT